MPTGIIINSGDSLVNRCVCGNKQISLEVISSPEFNNIIILVLFSDPGSEGYKTHNVTIINRPGEARAVLQTAS